MEFLRLPAKLKLSTVSVFLLLSHFIGAQDLRQNTGFWSHVRFGGGVGLNFGDGFFSGTLAPSAIYDINRQFSMGIGLNATYSSQKNVFNATVLGGSLIGLFNPIDEIQVSAEFEQLNVSQNFDDPIFRDDNYWYPALFMGVGYRSRNVTIGVRYDLLYDDNKSIYANAWAPFMRFFF
jgi:hypothetical protein